jgi:hypothetical protein
MSMRELELRTAALAEQRAACAVDDNDEGT